ncbi:hypothetical protein IGI04_027641 [Brassica rapa subsp. trilocularis]|uniref:Uncharacterized protein n=1 Tax=Brassica rapa subsp. trilocularis TaxID=1813537 RepID=A0ABQ7L2L5_BRACM|nr:hypothetical protein IGI04_027641 [Brassica rapa subsp. trilocularis]
MNHKHELTNQPDIDIHQRHEAVGLSDDAVVRFKTRRLPPSRPSPGPYTPVEPRAHIEQADRTAHHLWRSLNRERSLATVDATTTGPLTLRRANHQ